MANSKLNLTFLSDLYKVRQIIKELLAFFDSNLLQLNDNDRFDLRLIFSELLCNAVIHGNDSNKLKNVYITVEISDNIISATIMDEGGGFNQTETLEGLNDVNLEKENGRGMKLVFSLADSVSFNKAGNQIHFIKKVNQNG